MNNMDRILRQLKHFTEYEAIYHEAHHNVMCLAKRSVSERFFAEENQYIKLQINISQRRSASV